MSPPGSFVLERPAFDALFGAFAGRGYTVVGPTVRDGAIVYDELSSSAELPIGWTHQQDGGGTVPTPLCPPAPARGRSIVSTPRISRCPRCCAVPLRRMPSELGEAIELARVLGRPPAGRIVFGIEGKRFDAGAELPAGLTAALDATVESVVREVAVLEQNRVCG